MFPFKSDSRLQLREIERTLEIESNWIRRRSCSINIIWACQIRRGCYDDSRYILTHDEFLIAYHALHKYRRFPPLVIFFLFFFFCTILAWLIIRWKSVWVKEREKTGALWETNEAAVQTLVVHAIKMHTFSNHSYMFVHMHQQ